MSEDKGKRLWGGRFGEGPHQLMERINASIGVDRRLYLQDIRGSQAHAAMLARQGVLSPSDAEKIIDGLEQVKEEIEAGRMQWSDSLEDIHTHVEVRLRELIGEAAGRLHTARSRNDQVATDLRLWIMDAGRELDSALIAYQRALVNLAEDNIAVIMPGYTHLQRAQPVLFALAGPLPPGRLPGPHRGAAPGRGGPGRHQLQPGPGLGGPGVGLCRGVRQLPGRG